jgi:alginate O-acetyltransferase complex protein AlgI
MTVQSLTYLLFVPLVWLLWRMLPAGKARQLVLLCASYLFYATWGLGFLALLIFSSIVNFGLGNYLRRDPQKSRLWLGVGFNLLMLAVFRYLPGSAVAHQSSLLDKLLVPVGVSFWTFQALSYLFDLYREEEMDPSLLEFCLYMAFWPTVLSGPVCRMPEMLPQLRAMASPEWNDVAEGCRRMLIGLFMKVVLAQIMASGLQAGEGVDAGFDQFTHWGGLDVWALAFGYGFQLFFDFAGYSNIVIGTARLFGLRLAENFDRPYLSTTPSEFWTRWHMSLSFWIRDYVFLPLATLRKSYAWRYFALLSAMVLFGFWHGATILYVLWGAYHGVLLIAHRQLQSLGRRFAFKVPEEMGNVLSWSVTFPLMCLGWILFRAANLHQASQMFSAVLHPASYRHLSLKPNFYLVSLLMIAGYFAICGFGWMNRRWEESQAWKRTAWLLSPLVYSLLIIGVIVWSKQKSIFVYMQF